MHICVFCLIEDHVYVCICLYFQSKMMYVFVSLCSPIQLIANQITLLLLTIFNQVCTHKTFKNFLHPQDLLPPQKKTRNFRRNFDELKQEYLQSSENVVSCCLNSRSVQKNVILEKKNTVENQFLTEKLYNCTLLSFLSTLLGISMIIMLHFNLRSWLLITSYLCMVMTKKTMY